MPRPIADSIYQFYCYHATHIMFLFLSFIRKNTLIAEQDPREFVSTKNPADLCPQTDRPAVRISLVPTLLSLACLSLTSLGDC